MSTITGTTVSTGVTLSTSGSYASPLTITATGAVTTSSGDAIYGPGPGSPFYSYQAWTVGNYGAIIASGTTGNADGIDLKYGGLVSNGLSGAGSAYIAGRSGVFITGQTGTVANAGTIIGGDSGTGFAGVWLDRGGSVNNEAGGLIQSGRAGIHIVNNAGTVTNAGTILGGTSGSGFGHNGVYIGGAGGSVANVAGGLIESNGSGVFVNKYQTGTLTNAGTIESTNTVTANYAGVRMIASGIVDNSGLIVGPVGVNLGAGSILTNSGTIRAAHSYGVRLGSKSSLQNTGLIIGQSRGAYADFSNTVTNSGVIRAIGSTGIGIVFQQGGTVIDAGTIVGGGGTAIQFGAFQDGLLGLEAGYALNGVVAGAASRTDTLELLGTSGAPLTVDYNGLHLANFDSVLFGPDGRNRLLVSNVGGTLPVTVSGFTLSSDVIDLTAIGSDGAITGNDTVAHQVTISGSGGALTLQLDAGDATLFHLSSDGAGGTLIAPATLPDDFGGDRSSDILWRNSDSSLSLWTMNGATISGMAAPSFQGNPITPDFSWSVAALADFTADGRADLLWRNTDSTLAEWTMNGGTITAAQGVTFQGNPVSPDASWSVAGAADFTGDGRADLLWRNTNASLALWTMNGGTITAAQGVTFQGNPVAPDPATWSLAASADFTGDGVADLLWRNSDNSLAEWTMDGSTITAAQSVTFQGNPVAPDASWSVAGTGDFSGDGTSDILWRNTDGELDLWAMNGSTITAAQAVTFQGNPVSLDSSWTFDDVGDFNGDGKADVVWRNTDNTLAEWTMNGSTITSAAGALTFQGVSTTPDQTWQILT